MGSSTDWICTNKDCKRKIAQVSGGEDMGMHSITETRVCLDCGDISDYTIAEFFPSERFQATSFSKDRSNKDPACSNCGSSTKPWERLCPDCGALMKIDPLGTRTLWD